jgi:hypothetical protein
MRYGVPFETSHSARREWRRSTTKYQSSEQPAAVGIAVLAQPEMAQEIM